MVVKWTQEDERNWAADKVVLRKLKDRGEGPSAWLAEEFAELSERRKAAKPRRPKGEGAVYQRADGLWCTSVELPEGLEGRRRKVICRKDKGDVVTEMRKIQAELAKHGNIATSSTTVAKWMTHWMDDIAPLKIRPKTLAGYKTVVNGYIIPLLGRKRLDKLTAQDVRTLHTVMQSTPKDPTLRGKPEVPPGTVMLSSTYTLLAHNALSTALKVALREGKVTANVCELVDRPEKRVAEQKALDTPDAVKLLLHLGAALDKDGEEHKQDRRDAALWSTYLLTGARRGEILGLEADRVGDVLDLSWQLQRITDISKAPASWEYRSLGSTLYLTRPKSKAGWRIIPLVEPLRSILRLQIGAQKDGLVFTRDGKPWDPDGATKAWSAVLAKAGLPDDVVLHGARHTTVELLYAAKVPEDIIQAIVGHSTRAMTRSYKTRTDSARLIEGMESLSEILRPQIEA